MKPNQLINIDLFHHLNEVQLKKLSQAVRVGAYQKGKTIFTEGQKCENLYFVLTGKIKIYKLSSNGKEQILKIISKNEIFAEVPLFEQGAFPANAEALTQSEIGILSRENLLSLIHSDSDIVMNMLAILSKRLRHLTSMIEGLTLKESLSRFAAYLLDSAEQHLGAETFELDISKTLLANLLGTSRENLSRISQKMIKRELIRVDNKSITLLDKKELQKIANGLADID